LAAFATFFVLLDDFAAALATLDGSSRALISVVFDFFALFSATLNFTIWATSASGKGLSSGNLTDPFADSYTESSFLNSTIPEGAG